MAELKTAYLGAEVEASPDDIELNGALGGPMSANVQTLDVGPVEMISECPLTGARRDTLIFLPLSILDSLYSFPGKPSL